MKNPSALGLVLLIGLAAPAFAQSPAASLFRRFQSLRPHSAEELFSAKPAQTELQRIFATPVSENRVLSLWNLAKPLI